MQAIYNVTTDKVTIIGDRNEGQPRIWRVYMRLRSSEGRAFKKSVAVRQKCNLQAVVEICRDEMLIEHLEDEGVQFLGFEAYAR